MSLPQRVQDELQAAEALEAADKAARDQAPPMVTVPSELIVQPTPPSAPPPEPAPPSAQASQEEESFRHKYKSLQGVYNEDVVQTRKQLNAVTAELQALRANLAEKAAPPQEPASTVDPKDIETFGEEMMSMVQRYVTGAVRALDSRLAGLEAAVTGVAQKTAETQEQQFYTLLTKLVPDWRETNTDSRWLAWLGTADEVYGVPRQAALDHAFKSGDADRVATVFRAFKATLPVVLAKNLDAQITPDGAGNSAPPLQPESKPILSEKAITVFYRDMAQGKYAGREKEANAIEAQINSAVAEGRVR